MTKGVCLFADSDNKGKSDNDNHKNILMPGFRHLYAFEKHILKVGGKRPAGQPDIGFDAVRNKAASRAESFRRQIEIGDKISQNQCQPAEEEKLRKLLCPDSEKCHPYK